jgi:hypothetical protein
VDPILLELERAKDSRSKFNDFRDLIRSVKRLDRRYLARWAKQLAAEDSGKCNRSKSDAVTERTIERLERKSFLKSHIERLQLPVWL